MSWEERLRGAAYTAPSGKRATFLFDDVSRSFDKLTNGFRFPDAKGTYVQDSGASGYKYPLAIYFSGPDCDTQADEFEALLLETGAGRLEHPLYGVVDVVPFGTITRSDALKTEANQSKIELEFWETNLLIYPVAQADQLSGVFDAVTSVKDALGNDLLDSVDISNATALARFKAGISTALNHVQTTLGKIKNFSNSVSSLKAKITKLVLTPFNVLSDIKNTLGGVADSFHDFLTLPGTVTNSFKTTISGYKDLFGKFTSFKGTFTTKEEYKAACAGVTVGLSGLIVDLVESDFDTQGEAMEAAEDLLLIFEDVSGWVEEMAQNLGQTDSNEVYQQLHKAVMAAASYLVQQSFTLKKERKLVLNRSRTIIDLCAELYGEVDSALDFFIASNDLSGSEILEIPKGREILYYV